MKNTKKSKPVPYHHIVSDDLPIRRVHLEVRKFEMEHNIDISGLRDSMELRRTEDHAARRMALMISARVASKKYAVKTVRFPATWWDAFKLGFFPASALIRWPVQYTDVTLEASAYYPDIAIPDHAAYVEILVNSEGDKY